MTISDLGWLNPYLAFLWRKGWNPTFLPSWPLSRLLKSSNILIIESVLLIFVSPTPQPLKALTAYLHHTYHLVNPAFFYELSFNPRRVLTKPSKPCHNDGHDNEDSDYILYVNDWLGTEEGNRYLILDVLGQGTFGQVVKCQNMRTHEIVAVKVIKNKPAYFNQSMMEVTILEMVSRRFLLFQSFLRSPLHLPAFLNVYFLTLSVLFLFPFPPLSAERNLGSRWQASHSTVTRYLHSRQAFMSGFRTALLESLWADQAEFL